MDLLGLVLAPRATRASAVLAASYLRASPARLLPTMAQVGPSIVSMAGLLVDLLGPPPPPPVKRTFTVRTATLPLAATATVAAHLHD